MARMSTVAFIKLKKWRICAFLKYSNICCDLDLDSCAVRHEKSVLTTDQQAQHHVEYHDNASKDRVAMPNM